MLMGCNTFAYMFSYGFLFFYPKCGQLFEIISPSISTTILTMCSLLARWCITSCSLTCLVGWRTNNEDTAWGIGVSRIATAAEGHITERCLSRPPRFLQSASRAPQQTSGVRKIYIITSTSGNNDVPHYPWAPCLTQSPPPASQLVRRTAAGF